jgi:hypothetical protein
MLWRILQPTDEDETKVKKFHNDGLHTLYTSASITTFIKSKKGFDGHVV